MAEAPDADVPIGDETPLGSVVATDVELAGASDVCSVVGDVVAADRSGDGEHPARSAANAAAVIDHRAPGPVGQVGGCQQAKNEGRIEGTSWCTGLRAWLRFVCDVQDGEYVDRSAASSTS